MKDVLMIAFYYPPLGGVGAIRPLKFSKYLPEYDWNPTVLTTKVAKGYPQDKSMLSEIPPEQKVIRAPRYPISEVVRRFARGPLRKQSLLYTFIDPQYDWVPHARRLGKQIIKKGNFKAVVATAPPYSTLRVATALKSAYGIPIIADLRDPFTTNELIQFPSKLHKLFYTQYERKLLKQFDHIITTNEAHSYDIKNTLGLKEPPVTLVTNGYDPGDFNFDPPKAPRDRFVMGYVGSIYGKVSPRPFFQSLKLALQKNPEMRETSEVRFVGKMSAGFINSEARRAGVDDIVHVDGYLSHDEAIRFYYNCHMLFILGGMVSRSFPAKVFEYAATGKPVVCFDDPEVFGDFIVRNNLGVSVNGLKPQEGADKILDLYDAFKSGSPLTGSSKENAERFNRRRLTGDLTRVIESVIHSN
ncbi:MAG: glycosyltransferase [Candidatus Thorarchaeota archaeon]|jgi:glycosyltransferase involved in cell wall biosynthesis